jgi:hypothetical protein
MKAIWINAESRSMELVEYQGLADLQRMVGGYIEVAHRFGNGDILFVDEEGLGKDPKAWIIVIGAHQPFAGNGVITGGIEDDDGNLSDPVSEITHLATIIAITTAEP